MRVKTVGDESGAVDLFAHSYAENRYQFIAGKTNNGRYGDRPQVINGGDATIG